MASLLVVDDDETLLEVLYELFSGEHLCHTAVTAEDALELLRSQDYDVVVTDISMPGMSGESLFGLIKTYSPGTRVIFISGSKDKDFERRLRVKGAAGFLAKPFDLAEIKGRVALAAEARARF